MAIKDADRKLTRRQAENARAAIDVGKIIRKLQRTIDGKIEMTPGQIKAAMILLDKSLPTLQAVDSHISTDTPSMSREECEQALREYLLANPALVTQVMNRQPQVLELAKERSVVEVK